MKDVLQKNPWVVVVLVVIALGIAVFSGMRTFGPTKLPPKDQELAQEKETHDKLQQELQQKYGLRPVPYGLPSSAGQVTNGQIPAGRSSAPAAR